MATGDRNSGGIRPAEAVRSALEQIGPLTGHSPETVSALDRNGSGWTAQVEVVELARVPDSTSVLATYVVDLDEHGELLGFRRLRRYTRGQIGSR